jgi:hypothetical protein
MLTLHASPTVGYRAIVLAAVIAVSAMGCRAGADAALPLDGSAGSATPLAATTTAQPPVAADRLGDPDVQLILGDLRAARAQHDLRAFHGFRNQLMALLGATVVDDADAAYRQVLADLIAADALHEAPIRAHFRTQLRALCDQVGLVSAIEPCETDLAPYAD